MEKSKKKDITIKGQENYCMGNPITSRQNKNKVL